MSKHSQSEGKPQKIRERVITRARAEKLLSGGADPAQFTKHANYHVRRKAWVKMGRPLPEDRDEQNKFLATLQGMAAPKDAKDVPGFYALVRQRVLGEVPVKEEVVAEQAS